MDLCLEATRKLDFWSERLGESERQANSKDGIEAFVSMPSLLQARPLLNRHPVIQE
jgi:hypothetical protein